mmetsp:Transcript_10178/g.17987  ORF Transcript_10178/g.17987 Transcript_10178/m.17987 type:complete len:282 (-) Transcript_10178:13-858(-)
MNHLFDNLDDGDSNYVLLDALNRDLDVLLDDPLDGHFNRPLDNLLHGYFNDLLYDLLDNLVHQNFDGNVDNLLHDLFVRNVDFFLHNPLHRHLHDFLHFDLDNLLHWFLNNSLNRDFHDLLLPLNQHLFCDDLHRDVDVLSNRLLHNLGDRHPDFPLAAYGDWDLFRVLKHTVNGHLARYLNRNLYRNFPAQHRCGHSVMGRHDSSPVDGDGLVVSNKVTAWRRPRTCTNRQSTHVILNVGGLDHPPLSCPVRKHVTWDFEQPFLSLPACLQFLIRSHTDA